MHVCNPHANMEMNTKSMCFSQERGDLSQLDQAITSIQWLGFALTEAIVFYAFIFGLIAFFLG